MKRPRSIPAMGRQQLLAPKKGITLF